MVWYVAPVGAIISLLFAWIFYRYVVAQDPGNAQMQKIAGYVRQGAFAYLKQQYRGVGLFFVIAFVVFNIMAWGLHVLHPLVPWAFLTGGFFSGLAGFIGMNTATHASNRTAQAATKSLNKALNVAFRGGAVMGLTVVGLALIDISLWFWILNQYGMTHQSMDLKTITVIMLTFGMGASTQALFARLGGGIYTKAADVGADLVGKVEAGIPEDDPRNPATIADNVGDNVGDVAGMGADLYESYAGSILATAALGIAAAFEVYGTSTGFAMNFVIAPMIFAGLGAFLSIIGIFMCKTPGNAGTKELMMAMNRGVYGSSLLIAIVAYFVTKAMLPAEYSFGIFISAVVGLLAGILIGIATEYYTSSSYKPTQGIAKQSLYGPATVIIEGLSVGMKSTGIPVLVIAVGIIAAFAASKGFSHPEMGLYGIGFGAVGMLATLGITLAMDAYGPIADNAGGNAEMAALPEEVRQRTDALDAVGNTTAATGKGFAIGSAALTAMALLASYIEEVRTGLSHFTQFLYIPHRMHDPITNSAVLIYDKVKVVDANIGDYFSYYDITLMNPKFLVALFIGGMVTFVFAALTMTAVGRAAGQMVAEVRRQFKEIPGIMEGKAEPEYAKCVHISTIAAQHEMVLPALIGILTPVIAGLFLGVTGVMGILAGAMSTGFVLACMMNNAGGAWDNAKKYIESGQYGGKRSEAHKATVTGDTVGDPFKDTAGPCMNIVIKLMSMISIVFAGLIVRYSPYVQKIYDPNTVNPAVVPASIQTLPSLAPCDSTCVAPCDQSCPDCKDGQPCPQCQGAQKGQPCDGTHNGQPCHDPKGQPCQGHPNGQPGPHHDRPTTK
jgi:K(+)-stimulated pyrophosphate-energized sodium pump